MMKESPLVKTDGDFLGLCPCAKAYDVMKF